MTHITPVVPIPPEVEAFNRALALAVARLLHEHERSQAAQVEGRGLGIAAIVAVLEPVLAPPTGLPLSGGMVRRALEGLEARREAYRVDGSSYRCGDGE